jgi:hypothetical protein
MRCVHKLTEQGDWDNPSAKYRRWQSELWLRAARFAPLLLALPHEPAIHSSPDWIGSDPRQHAYQEP